jgi:hypothetical protein
MIRSTIHATHLMDEIHQTINRLYAQVDHYVGELTAEAKKQPDNIIDIRLINEKKLYINQLKAIYTTLSSYQKYIETKTKDLSDSYRSDIFRLEAVINDANIKTTDTTHHDETSHNGTSNDEHREINDSDSTQVKAAQSVDRVGGTSSYKQILGTVSRPPPGISLSTPTIPHHISDRHMLSKVYINPNIYLMAM